MAEQVNRINEQEQDLKQILKVRRDKLKALQMREWTLLPLPSMMSPTTPRKLRIILTPWRGRPSP